MFRYFFFSFCFLFGLKGFSQIALDQTAPYDVVNYLVEDVLIGGAVNVSNISYDGVPSNIGYFQGATGDIQLPSGIFMVTTDPSVITTFNATGIGSGAANPTEDDLVAQLNAVNATNTVLNNLVILEFDFVASGEVLEFEYVFASHEYQSYTCSDFNDIFGFFISGPGINGPFADNAVNIARIPDPSNPSTFTNTPVIINALNGGAPTGGGLAANCDNVDPNWQNYTVFFTDNIANAATPNIGFNGFTVPLTAQSALVCGETYHIKLAIADVLDGGLNSAVFLKEGSFNITLGSTEQQSELEGSINEVVEGCFGGFLNFNIESPVSQDFVVKFDIEGSATAGLDYVEFPDSAIIPAGDTNVQIGIQTLIDELDEGTETIIISTIVCGDEVSNVDTFFILDPLPLEVFADQDTVICATQNPINVSFETEGGYGPFTHEWIFNGEIVGTGTSLTVLSQDTGMYTITSTGLCGYTSTDSILVSSFPPEPLPLFTSFFDVATTTVVEGCEYASFSVDIGTPLDVDTFFNLEVVGGSAEENVDYFEIERIIHIPAGDSIGSVQIEAIADGEFEPDETIILYFPYILECSNFPTTQILTIVSNPDLNVEARDTLNACFGEEFTLETDAIGGIPPYSYTWKKGDATWTSKELDISVEDTAVYFFEVKDICDNTVEDSMVVIGTRLEEIQLRSVYAPKIDMCIEDYLELSHDIEGGLGEYRYTWYSFGNVISTDPVLELQFDAPTTALYTLEVSDECGNSGSTSYEVRVSHCDIPNVFSPNGDNINDAFTFETEDVNTSVYLSVQDRWGNSVYRSNSYELCNNEGIDCWTGQYQGTEELCDEGIYFYIIRYDDGREYKGTVSLFR